MKIRNTAIMINDIVHIESHLSEWNQAYRCKVFAERVSQTTRHAVKRTLLDLEMTRSDVLKKNNFVERSKILAGYIRKVILLNQNNYVERSNQLLEYQNFLQYYLLFLWF